MATRDDERQYIVIVWDVAAHQKPITLKGFGAPISSLQLSPDGKMLASKGVAFFGFSQGSKRGLGWNSADERAIKLWNIESGHQVTTAVGLDSRVSALGFSADASLLVSGTQDGTVRIRDLNVDPRE